MVNDTVIGRIGTIIDMRKSNIKRYRKMLKNKNLDKCTKMHIERELKSEQDCLIDAMNLDSIMSIIKTEFEEIKKEYCQPLNNDFNNGLEENI